MEDLEELLEDHAIRIDRRQNAWERLRPLVLQAFAGHGLDFTRGWAGVTSCRIINFIIDFERGRPFNLTHQWRLELYFGNGIEIHFHPEFTWPGEPGFSREFGELHHPPRHPGIQPGGWSIFTSFHPPGCEQAGGRNPYCSSGHTVCF